MEIIQMVAIVLFWVGVFFLFLLLAAAVATSIYAEFTGAEKVSVKDISYQSLVLIGLFFLAAAAAKYVL